ncbi:MAG TPA: DUF6788 family protein [Pyrinomonadaceae bacterium]|nr:DUF6788 family protein [Pyrinomonadaceae bacterium]
MKTKNQSLQPKMLDGYVRAERVMCGKANCKCSRGELHGVYFYRYTWDEGRRRKSYIKRSEVEQVRAACAEYRKVQVELRRGRAEWRATLKRARELFAFLSHAERHGLL